MFWLWLFAITAILLAVVISLLAIDEDIAGRKDKTRAAWWPDPENEDKGKRDNERPYIS